MKLTDAELAAIRASVDDDNGQNAKHARRALLAHIEALEAALVGCIEHMEWSTPRGKAAWTAAGAAIDRDRLAQITDGAEVSELLARKGDLGVPRTLSRRVGSKIEVYANADDLRAWRAAQSTSGDKHG